MGALLRPYIAARRQVDRCMTPGFAMLLTPCEVMRLLLLSPLLRLQLTSDKDNNKCNGTKNELKYYDHGRVFVVAVVFVLMVHLAGAILFFVIFDVFVLVVVVGFVFVLIVLFASVILEVVVVDVVNLIAIASPFNLRYHVKVLPNIIHIFLCVYIHFFGFISLNPIPEFISEFPPTLSVILPHSGVVLRYDGRLVPAAYIQSKVLIINIPNKASVKEFQR